jgi:hypothetical protein
LSRACLGKKIIYVYKWLKNASLRDLLIHPVAGLAVVPLAAALRQERQQQRSAPSQRVSGASMPSLCSKLDRRCENGSLFQPFMCKNEHFTKTGSGQT